MLETVCEVREVERCEGVLEEECSLVDEVVLECREGNRQEYRLKNRSVAVWRGSSSGRGQLEENFP